MLLKATFETEAGNRAIRDGSLMKIIQNLHARLKPEACYYTTVCGKRTGLFFFDCKETSSSFIVEVAEPLFIGLNASVSLEPVMNDADLQRGFEAWQKSGA
jgi:hypothetical protein